ncbi:trihydroxytoluene oxygenase [Trichodelitschia bisporula]|uniref:Trihydroxytoluene oxygenase n=1 Tax=Trichodelitschia bisporula TaxID=703511 RepID=A0A6G1HSS3_9PEZI|nr:trihydroxytoluene oxygenase [Trichodelitschia bisporula]
MGDSIKEQTTRPPPNRGASIPDTEAAGPDSITIAEWRRTNAIDPAAQIRLVKLSHMCYQHPNLPDIITFLQDFGMRVVKQTDDKVWLRGYGTDPYVYYAQRGPLEFLGGTFLVESLADLKRASRLPGASAIKDLDDAPGGGRLVTVRDPEGFPVNLLFGQEEAEAGTLPPKLEANSEADKPRTRKFLRFQPGPAGVHKLGHFGLCVQQFDEQVRWYTKTFNLIPSDFIYVPTDGDRKMVAMFAHIDRGQDNVDHHTFFVASNPTSHVHHSSYEVHDLDTQQLGHQWLARKGYKSVWGIGRHLLGSQIFDYWWDTSGFMVEHYADGDLVNEDTPIGFTKAGHESLAVWGPEVPEGFLD